MPGRTFSCQEDLPYSSLSSLSAPVVFRHVNEGDRRLGNQLEEVRVRRDLDVGQAISELLSDIVSRRLQGIGFDHLIGARVRIP